MRFKFRQMEVFWAVMTAGSVSGAARLLYVSQPAVSKLLAHTETNLGLTLFHRTGGRLIPTKVALSLFEEVSTVYEAALKVDAFVESALASPLGKVNIVCSPSLGLNVVPDLIAKFLELHPDVKVALHTTLIEDMPSELLSGKADLAISVLPVEAIHLKSERLIDGKMVCAVPEHHPLAQKNIISLEDMCNAERLILYSRNIPFGRLLMAAFDRHQCTLKRVLEVPRAELACSLVCRGVGVAIVDEFSVRANPWQGVVVRPLKEDIPITVSLVQSLFSRPEVSVEQFVDLTRNDLGSTPIT